MSKLYIAVFKDAKEIAFGSPVQEEVVDYTSTSVQSTALQPSGANVMYRVRVFSDADCFVTWGDNPTALITGAEGRPIGASNPEYFGIPAGQKLAVIERV